MEVAYNKAQPALKAAKGQPRNGDGGCQGATKAAERRCLPLSRIPLVAASRRARALSRYSTTQTCLRSREHGKAEIETDVEKACERAQPDNIYGVFRRRGGDHIGGEREVADGGARR